MNAQAAMSGSVPLLALPAELRLEVYRALFEDCLANGYPAEVAGLHRSCRQIHGELESDFMTTVRPLLVAKYHWKSILPKDDMPCVRMSSGLNATTENAKLFVNMPLERFYYCHSDRVGEEIMEIE